MVNLNETSCPENEQYPIEPSYHPANRLLRKIYDFMASAKLAMTLLITILLCCLCGVTVYKGEQAAKMIFGTLWFNGLLVLLVINTACCFFGRMWGRKITVISFGMILFHLSFVAMFLAIAFNSLFSFEGKLRITEGETLSNRDPKSYDIVRHGLFFDYSFLKGETTLLQVHRGFKVDGEDKLIAYDISLTDGGTKTDGVIYINNKFSYRGVDYFRDKEGFSLLTIANDGQGKELHGVHIPLQSLSQKDNTILYATGTMLKPGLINFPPDKDKHYFAVQLSYFMDKQKGRDRNGRVRFQVWPVINQSKDHSGSMPNGSAMGAGGVHAGSPSMSGHAGNPPGGGMGAVMGSATGHSDSPPAGAAMKEMAEPAGNPLADGTVNIGEKLLFGNYQLFVPEVRYWVGMNVNYNPGKPFVLASLLVGLVGIVITMTGRMTKRKN